MTNQIVNKMSRFTGCSLILLILSFSSIAREGILIRASELKGDPSYQAKAITQLQAGAFVQIIERKGGWYRVKNKQFSGWLPLLSLRFPMREQNATASQLPTLLSMTQGHSAITATTGVRGVGAADIKKARPDFVALQQMQQFAVSEAEARLFAKKGGLQTKPVDLEEGQQ